MKIYADVQKLELGERVELFEMDASLIGGDVLLFHGYEQLGSIWFGGEEYSAWPIQAEGFAKTSEGQQPTPKLSVGNVDQTIGALCDYLDDLVGALVIRRVTLGKFLDARNYPGGNPEADPEEQFDPDVWRVEQKLTDNGEIIEFELSNPLDMDGEQIPRRQVIANVCTWKYRGTECGWTGVVFYDRNDNLVADASQDRCGKRLSSCQCRFGRYEEIPVGTFPAADIVRT